MALDEMEMSELALWEEAKKSDDEDMEFDTGSDDEKDKDEDDDDDKKSKKSKSKKSKKSDDDDDDSSDEDDSDDEDDDDDKKSKKSKSKKSKKKSKKKDDDSDDDDSSDEDAKSESLALGEAEDLGDFVARIGIAPKPFGDNESRAVNKAKHEEIEGFEDPDEVGPEGKFKDVMGLGESDLGLDDLASFDAYQSAMDGGPEDDEDEDDIIDSLGDGDFDTEVDGWEEDTDLASEVDADEKALTEEEDYENKKMNFDDGGSSDAGGDAEAQPAISEGKVFEGVRPIAFSEDYARLFKRGGKFLIMESDLEAVYNYYAGAIDGYAVHHAIAEAHNINPADLIVMLTEGEVGSDDIKLNKAKPAPAEKKPAPTGKMGGALRALMNQKYRILSKANKSDADKTMLANINAKIKKLKARRTLAGS